MVVPLKLLNGYDMFYIISSEDIKNKKEQAEFSPKDQLSSTPIDMSQSEPMKTLNLTNLSPNNNSKTKSQESEDIDPTYILFFNTILHAFKSISLF